MFGVAGRVLTFRDPCSSTALRIICCPTLSHELFHIYDMLSILPLLHELFHSYDMLSILPLLHEFFDSFDVFPVAIAPS